MADEIANGNYIIVSAEDTSLCLEAAGGANDVRDGQNAQVWTINYSAAQTWKVVKTKTGHEILSRFLGKALDMTDGKIQSGTNVQLYQANDTRAQRWNIVATGETKTIGDTSYPLYYVYAYTNKNVVLDVAGDQQAASGTNVRLWKFLPNAGQKWAFVPVPAFRSGGVYEVRSYLSPSKMTLDAEAAKHVNGTNLQIYAVNHTNAQKFYLADEGDGWSIRNVESGKYVDVTGDDMKSGTNVQLYEDNDTRAQRWKVAEYGTAEIDGKKCEVVEFGAGNSAKYNMDVYGAVNSNGTNVQIYAANHTKAQQWALWSTCATDPNMPVPCNIKLAYKVGGDSYVNVKQPDDSDEFGTLHPTWQCSDAWVTDGSNSYRWRWRKRYMKGTTSSWQPWGAWTDWETASAYSEGTSAWETHGFDVGYKFSDNIKNCQVEIQVCSQGVEDNATENIASDAADQVCGVIRRPTVTVTGAAWACDGLRVSYETDYPYGTIAIHLKTLEFAGSSALKKAIDVSARSGTFLIPQSGIKSQPADGATATMTFALGNDQCATFGGGDVSGSATVAYDAGTVDVAPAYRLNDNGLALDLTVPHANTVRMWMVYDGKTVELEGTVANGETSFSALYPFDMDFALFTSYISSDGSEWGTDYTVIPDLESPRAHAWNWDGGFLALWLDAEFVKESRSYGVQADEHVLVGREHPVVSFLSSSEGRSFTSVTSSITGVLMDDDKYGCTADDVEELLAAGHVTYRSPAGRIATVAIKAAEVTQRRLYAEVSVDQTEEQL